MLNLKNAKIHQKSQQASQCFLHVTCTWGIRDDHNGDFMRELLVFVCYWETKKMTNDIVADLATYIIIHSNQEITRKQCK